jgi:hypothetical protein
MNNNSTGDWIIEYQVDGVTQLTSGRLREPVITWDVVPSLISDRAKPNR